jgi:hypothetical protein
MSSAKNENAEIIAGHVAALKRLREGMAAREELKRARAEQRKRAWQLSEIARVEGEAPTAPTAPTAFKNLTCYSGYLDGYWGGAC